MPSNNAGLADVSTYRRWTASMKLAVFQVSETGARAHLVCLEMRSLQSAADLEHWLRMNVGPKTDVKLLGRFDSVQFALSETEIESLVLHRGGMSATDLNTLKGSARWRTDFV